MLSMLVWCRYYVIVAWIWSLIWYIGLGERSALLLNGVICCLPIFV
jgi:hypothetical protein